MNGNDSRKKILIADDEAINLEFFDVMLSKLGFEVRQARDGAEALEILSKWKPDLILLDNVLPRLSGWELTRIIRSSESHRDISDVPIIMFSAMDDVKDKVEGLEIGADDYITKPFNFSEVLARIRASGPGNSSARSSAGKNASAYLKKLRRRSSPLPGG
jgi:DNA-binding response OmpR family regulator